MSDPHVMHRGHAPTPFTAAQIRTASPPGLTIEVETTLDGVVVSRGRTVFGSGDVEGVHLEQAEVNPASGEVESSRAAWVSWAELQSHASFPVPDTEVSRERIETPLGQLECARYDVRTRQGPMRLWFADAHPGMPVAFGPVAGDGAGLAAVAPLTVVTSMALVSQ